MKQNDYDIDSDYKVITMAVITMITMRMSKMMILTPYNIGYNIMKEGNTNDKNIY